MKKIARSPTQKRSPAFVDGRRSNLTCIIIVASAALLACLLLGNLDHVGPLRIALPTYELRRREVAVGNTVQPSGGSASESVGEWQSTQNSKHQQQNEGQLIEPQQQQQAQQQEQQLPQQEHQSPADGKYARPLAPATRSHDGAAQPMRKQTLGRPARVVLTVDYNSMAGSVSREDSFEVACEKTGRNVGNMVWLYAASNVMLDPAKNTIMTPKTRDGDVDAMIVPSANIIWNMSDLDRTPKKDAMLRGFAAMRPIADDTPRFIIGIGVRGMEGLGTSNSELHGDLGETYITTFTAEDYILPSQYVKTLRTIGDDVGAIGVRGPFTEQLLHNYGVDQAVALGCPSLFLNPAPNLGAIIQGKIDNLGHHSKIAINLPQRWVPRLMTYLLRLAMQSDNHAIIWQSMSDIYFLKRAEKELGISIPPEKIHWFRDFETWSAFVCTYDAIIGSRIHGNMIGMACPTPMLLIASDIRTQEMGAGMKIPMLLTNHTMFQQIGPLLDASNQSRQQELPSIMQLFAATDFDSAMFDKNRYLQASRYQRIFSGLNIEPSERINQLASMHA